MAEELPLIEAAKSGNLAGVRERLELGDDVDQKNSVGCNALIWAANNGHTAVVQLLIDWGAQLDVATTAGRTIATLAAPHPATAAVIAAAVQQPRGAPGPKEKWAAMGPTSVAFVGYYPSIDRKLTQVFNFETRQQLILSENLRTRMETAAAPTSFDDLPPRVLEKAMEEFQGFGGKPDRDYILAGGDGIGKSRKMPAPGGGHG